MEAEKLKKYLEQIPNNVSGDGASYAKKVKQFLRFFCLDTNEQIEQGSVGGAAQVTGVMLEEINTTDANGMPQNNIKVTFNSSSVTDYASAQIWFKAQQDDVFRQAGSTEGTQYVIEDVTKEQVYIVKVVAVNSKGGTAAFEEAPQALITIQGGVLVPDAPTQFVLTWDNEGPLWEWLYNDNGYIDFFELRLDEHAGVYDENLLERTRNTYSRANPNVRSGTAYLFVRNIFGTYSAPATRQFSKAVGSKPNKPVLSKVIKGVNIHMDDLPAGYKEYKIIINGNDVYYTANNDFVYFVFAGQISVQYCFVDDIGDGELSDILTEDVQLLVQSGDIAAGAVTGVSIAENAITAAHIEANAITSNKIAADAITADKLAVGSVTANAIAANAVRANAIQAGSIIAQHISAGAVTADKLAANTITLSGALQIVGGAVTLNEDGLKAMNTNGSYTLFNEEGMNFYDGNGVKFAGVGRFMIGVAKDGQYIKFTQPWDITPSVIVIPQQLQTSVAGYSTLDLDIISNALELSKNGFRVQVKTVLKAGSGGSQILNTPIMTRVNVIQNNNYTASKTITPPDGATRLSATVNIVLEGTTYTHQRPPIGGITFPPVVFLGAAANASIYLKVNGKTVDSIENVCDEYFGTSDSVGSTDLAANFTVNSNFSDDDVITIEVKGWGNRFESGHNAWTTAVLNSIQYDVATDSVVSSGTGTFIVTDGNSANYTITN